MGEYSPGIEPLEKNLQRIKSIEEHRFPFLYNWISAFPHFLELEKYIFVHGGVNGDKEDWKQSTRKEFTWGKEFTLPIVKDHTVVCGHTRVATIRKESKDYEILYKDSKELFDILYLDGKIMIDRFVEVSHELNVLILDI